MLSWGDNVIMVTVFFLKSVSFRDTFRNIHWWKKNQIKPMSVKSYQAHFPGVISASANPTKHNNEQMPNLRPVLGLSLISQVTLDESLGPLLALS